MKAAEQIHHGDTENTESHGECMMFSVNLRVLRVSVVKGFRFTARDRPQAASFRDPRRYANDLMRI